jgi:hypothetical protein
MPAPTPASDSGGTPASGSAGGVPAAARVRPGEAIVDLSCPFPQTPRGTAWEAVTDAVMGGLSAARLVRETVAGRPALRLTGTVRLENGGGFVQMALDLAAGGAAVDASACAGIALTVRGNGQTYGLHLRTLGLDRPWQSYRQAFAAGSDWAELLLPFAGFRAHRTDLPFDPSRLRRIGIVAIGRAFAADVALAGLRFA